MAYTKIGWVNDRTPAINQNNLNHMDQGIFDAHSILAEYEDIFTGDVDEAVQNWLDEHPEATTTVQDGSITKAKLHSTLKVTADMFIHNEVELADAINNPQYKAYFLGDIEINNPIDIEDSRDASKLTFIGGRLVLNTNLFTNSSIVAGSPSLAWAIPNFVGTYFERGEYDTLFELGFYPLWGHFTNCYFINVAYVRASVVVQSPRFENCFFVADANTPSFINANALYDAKFSNCDLEASYVPLFINVEKDETWGTGGGSGMRQVSFVNCISEGRTNPLVRFCYGDVRFYAHYAEGNTAPLVEVYKASYQGYQFHAISLINSFFHTVETNQHVVVIENDYNYENTTFTCIGCEINNCILVNTNKFFKYIIKGCEIVGNATIYPSETKSKIGTAVECGATMGRCYTNGIGFFKTGQRTIYIRPELTFLTFMSAYNGSFTTFVLVAGARSTSNPPSGFAYCLSHPSLTFTVTYNSTIDMLEITIPEAIGVFQYSHNMSATKIGVINNDTTATDYYHSKALNGFDPLDFKEIFTS